MWQSSYSYDDSQTFAYGYQSTGPAGYEGPCENSAPQQDDVPQQGGFPSDDFPPEGSSYGEHYQTQEFYYYHSEHHVDSSAFHA